MTATIPHDEAAERGAIGCILLADDAASHLLSQLRAGHFHDHRHAVIYDALVELIASGESPDLIKLSRQLGTRLPRAGGMEYLGTVPDSAPVASNFEYWLDIIEDKRRRRELLALAEKAQSFATDPTQDSRAMLSSFADTGSAVLEDGRKHQGLTLRRPDEIVSMKFDDSDVLLGDRLLAKGQSLVIAAQGGSGKSRLVLQLLGCMVSGRQFLNLPTGGQQLRWLVLQTENSNRRLQADLKRLRDWLGDSWERFCEQVRIHTIETDRDGFVSLDSPDNQQAIRNAIESDNFGGVVVDPLNDFGIGDLNRDGDMKATLQALSRVCRHGNPDRAIGVLHHAIVGKGGAVKAIGYDRGAFARNSKVLNAWTRGQINLAPVDPDSNDRLIVACGKCSNGREFPAFAIRLTEGMIYEPDTTVDVAAWERDMSGASDRSPLMTPEQVAELCRLPTAKATLAKLIMDDCGCGRQSAYRYIKKAEMAKKIRWNPKTETYCQK